MKKTTIGTRLMCSFGAMGVAVALFAITCWQITGKLTGELDKAVNGMARKQFLAGQISTAASDMTSLERGVAFATVLQQAEKARALKAQVEDRQVQVRETLKEFAGLADTPVLRQALSDLEREAGDATRAHVELGRLLDAGQMDLALKHFDDVMLPRLSAVSERAKRIVEEERQRLADVAQTASITSNRSRMVTLGLIGVCIVALAGVLLEIRRTTRRLRAITSEMSASASRVSGASEQVSSLSRTLADGAARQAASLEETSASSHETSSLTASNAERANQVASLMREVDGRIECANRTLEQMIASMRDIKASGEKIARIIKVIDEISFQTNILALNAAVEAARAGEAGMGFAVVADEVRNLAQRCAQAAKDTSELIEDSIRTSGEGAARIDEMAAAVRDITSRASDAKRLVEDVNTGSQEQARGIDHIARTLASMEQVTQQTAASAEEGAASAAALSSESTRMTAVVEELVGLVG